MTLEQWLEDPRAAPRRRALARRLVLTEGELRDRDAREEAELREWAESDRLEVRPVAP